MYKDQSRYTGEWKNNKKWGNGTIEFADMSGWKGKWEENKRHGKGEAFNRARRCRTETYEKGKLVYKEPDKNLTEFASNCESRRFARDENDSLMEFGENLLNFMGYEYDNPSNWNNRDCIMFLKHQKLERYENIFKENEIDGESLMKITERDLKQMGILAKGHRIRLREAIKKLRKLTKEEIRKKLKENEIKVRKLSSLIHPESMDQKILSYYDKLDIVEEGNASSEGSKQTETNVINSLSPMGKLSSNSKVESNNEISNFIMSPMRPLLLKKSQSYEVRKIKRRTYSDNDIFDNEMSSPKFHDDNFPINKEDNLSTIQEKDLDMICENQNNDLDLDDEERNCDSILVQPTTSSSSSSSSGSSEQESEPGNQEYYMIDIKKVVNWKEVQRKPYVTCYQGRILTSDCFIKRYKRKGKKRKRTYYKIKSDAKKLIQVCHKNIVLFMGVAIDKHHFYLFTEYMKNGSVYDQLHTCNKSFDEKMIIKVLLSVARGMSFLHGIDQMHGALKSSNILISEDWEFKFVDFFGFSGVMEKYHRYRKLKKRKDTETPYWLAPEILIGDEFGKKIDVYAFGIMIWEILNSEIPYETWSLEDMIEKIGNDENYRVPYPKTNLNTELIDIMYRCLDRDPEKRPNFVEIVQDLQSTKHLTDRYIMKELYNFFGPSPN